MSLSIALLFALTVLSAISARVVELPRHPAQRRLPASCSTRDDDRQAGSKHI